MTKYRIYSDLAVDAVQRATADKKRPEMTWRDHLGMMLHIGAEIEHSLMVQYLYAAYSLGGEQVPPKHRAMVAEWQLLAPRSWSRIGSGTSCWWMR